MSVVTINTVWNQTFGSPEIKVAYPACGNAHQGRAANSLTPLALAGQNLRADANLETEIKLANRERSRSLIAKVLTEHAPLITDLHRSGFISESLLGNCMANAKEENALAFSDALSALMTDSIGQIHNMAMKAVTEAFSGLPELLPVMKNTMMDVDLFTLAFMSTGDYQVDAHPIALAIGDSDYFAHYFLGLEQFDKAAQPYLYRAVQLAVWRGGGATADQIVDMDYSELYSATTDETFEWISNCISQIESLPEDASVNHLFSFPEGSSELEDLYGYLEERTILMDGLPDEVSRDDLLDALTDTQRLMNVIMYYKGLEQGVSGDIHAFLELPLPEVETELCRKVRSVVEVVAAIQARNDLTDMIQPEDMYYPFGYVMHPSEEVNSDQEHISQSVYEMAMNSGESYEVYFPDTSKAGWIEQVQAFSVATFSVGLLYKLISGEAQTKSCANSELA
jgi:hypothetical protein